MAGAQAVPYQIFKDGSSEQSYASAYFVNPANVTVINGQYHVAVSIATTHDLGSFPVTIGSIAGQTPSISKRTQGNTDYYTFNFLTTNLTSLVNGAMHVDVDALNYHHDYGFGLKFNATSLPPLTAVATPKASASSSTTSSQVTSHSASSPDNKASSSQSNSAKTSSSSSLVNKVSQTSSSAVTQSVTTVKQTSPATNSFLHGSTWMYAVGGIGGGGILVGLLMLFKKH
nr:NEAT domain-containing protein [Periweissella fabalis]